jgi:hypothetical protein
MEPASRGLQLWEGCNGVEARDHAALDEVGLIGSDFPSALRRDMLGASHYKKTR